MNSKKTILCVENDGDTCELITFFLEAKNFQVVHCESPEEAIRYARTDRYAAIITDFYFKGINGIDLCRAVRSFNQTIPIIFFTAEARPENKQAAIEAGAQSYITIPAIFEEVTQIVIQFIVESELA